MLGRITLHSGDLLDQSSLISMLREMQPEEVYNLAAQSFVPASWTQPIATAQCTALWVTQTKHALAKELRLGNLEARRD